MGCYHSKRNRRANLINTQRRFAAVDDLSGGELNRVHIFGAFELPCQNMGICAFGRDDMNVVGANHHDHAGSSREMLRVGEFPDLGGHQIIGHDPGDKICLSDEVGYKGSRGDVVNRFRGIELLQSPPVQDCDTVGHGKRFVVVMSDKDGRGLGLSKQGVEILSHAARHVGVEIAERFVEQQQHRAQGEGAGERDALLLSP